MQMRVQQLEQEEQERWEGEKQQKVSYQQTQLMKKHATELKAFHKKVQSKIEGMKKERALELEKLLQKYQNIKKDMEAQQTLELKRLEKRPTTAAGSSVFSSRYSPHKSSASKKVSSKMYFLC